LTRSSLDVILFSLADRGKQAVKCPRCQFENPRDTHYCGRCGNRFLSSKDIAHSQAETLFAPIPEPIRGTIFAGRYEIIEELGRGGMGQVYKAFDKEIEETIALKLLNPEIAADEEIIKRFRNELKLARQITHKNVCRMFDLGKSEGTFFITMEYVSGEDLKSFIRRAGQLSIGKSLLIAKQVGEGLAEAHRLGVVHRDLKSQNIMIDRQGNAKIMDFGIARSIARKDITREGMMIGTPEYMSPEQVDGKEADRRSDLYGLGIILYEMLTGRVPFEGDTPLSVALKHKTETPRNPQQWNAQISEGLRRMMDKCLEKDQEQRYQSAEEVLAELTKLETEKSSGELRGAEREREPGKQDKTQWIHSIAVLPFADLSPQKDQEYFCDGVAEELINALTKIRELRVVARTSAFSFKGRDADIREIGRKLGVETILEGSVRKAGNRLRITAQLINIADGYHLWAERYDREMDDVFAIQDEVTLAITEKLKIKFLEGDKSKIIKRYTEDLEAYQLYLKGRYFWNKRAEKSLEKAIEYFEQAIETDPNYALAYSGLADCYNLLPWWSMTAPRDAHPKAKTAAMKALEIDPHLAEAHTSLAFALMQYDWNWPAAEREFKAAIELNRGYAAAHHWYFEFLAARGRLDEALAEILKAQALDPLSLIINSALGWQFYFARNYDQAINQSQKTLELDPNFMWAQYILSASYLQSSRADEVIGELQKSAEGPGGHPLLMAVLGAAYATRGHRDKAQGLLEGLKKQAGQNYVMPFYIAIIYLGLGEKAQVFEWLERAYEERNYWLVFLKADPMFDSLHSEPRFRTLLGKVGLEE